MQEAKSKIRDTRYEILVWLPSPVGDAVLATPALRALRRYFKSSRICYYTSDDIRQVLSPTNLNDTWIEQRDANPFMIAGKLRRHKFTHAILMKNSLGSALAVWLAGIPSRTGYVRDGRGLLLNSRLYPSRLPGGKFKPASMIDYYLAIARRLGADTNDRRLELLVDHKEHANLMAKLPELASCSRPITVIIPGAGFGPSKCWPAQRFAKVADWLIDRYNHAVVISAAPNALERAIAQKVSAFSRHGLISLAEKPLNLGELKALLSICNLVITNDTGPRHIAIALGRKVVTVFGPNDQAWTDTGYEDEIRIAGNAVCAPCNRPTCGKSQHLCMEAITVEMVCDAVQRLSEQRTRTGITNERIPHNCAEGRLKKLS
ncbi:MAG: lipopolysaccharide heptosyltransferase II [Phycisphaerales bacterium]|nr:MAG: lipopolysaccharide heptosyltransferase II [Phycisphaerales bacterium]